MGMFKNFLLKQVMKSKMKGVPEAEQEKIMAMVEKNPDFFKRIGEEIEAKKKSGKSELEATMEVMRKNQAELQKLL
ncbi:MAG: hypothetical protein AB200_01050 [Parcubacteria bacterium C7867-005]|nr:MAG: hypothetical protein AB200_01050 [Parcubacteria bacterium C7867-005]